MEIETGMMAEPASAGVFTPEEQEESAIDRLLRYAASVNIAEELDKTELTAIGALVKREYEIDDESRSEWRERFDKAMDIAKQTLDSKDYPWRGASNIKYPLVQTAAMQFHARAYPAIVPGRGLVKHKVIGFDPDGQKNKRGERIAKHLSYQLIEEMEEWEEDTDKLLLILAVTGSVFRKTYYSPSLGRNVSEMATADKVIVNYGVKSLNRAPRVTHEIELYPHEVTERVRAGVFLDVELGEGKEDDKDKPIAFLEQHRLYDLDEDGYPEPYIVTVHKESGKVVRIIARYDEDKIYVDGGSIGEIRAQVAHQNRRIQQLNLLNAAKYREMMAHGISAPPPPVAQPESVDFSGMEVKRIEPIQYFTMYGFIPSIDGGFYYDGLGALLLPINEAINTNINMLFDAGHAANTGGGFIGSSLKLAKKSAGEVRFSPNEYKRVDTGGLPLRDAIYQLQFQGPSAVLFELLGMLVEAGREIASVKDVLTGDMPVNQPATTTLAAIEQGLQVFTAIYKRIHRSFKQELKKLRDLNAKYLPRQVYFSVLDSQEQQQVTLQDYRAGDIDVVPVSDPTVVTEAQRIERANAMMAMKGDPFFDEAEINMMFMEAIKIENPERFINKTPPQPNPLVQAEMEKIANERARIENDRMKIENSARKTSADILMMLEDVRKIRSEVIRNLAEAEAAEVGAQLDVYESRMRDIVSELEGSGNERGNTARSNGGVPGVAARPGNQAISAVSGGV